MRSEDVVQTARGWVGTPYHHQQCTKGAGVDCAQLVVGVAVELGVLPMPGPEARTYSRLPTPSIIEANLRAHMVEVPKGEERPGDVVWLRSVGGAAMHLGILSDLHGLGIIHSTTTDGKVVETAFTRAMQRQARSFWRFPDLEVDTI